MKDKKPETPKEWLLFTARGVDHQSEEKKEASIVSELIEEGFLRGTTRTDANGDTADFQIRGITLKGRSLLADLIQQDKERSILWKLKEFFFFIGGIVLVKAFDYLDYLLGVGQ